MQPELPRLFCPIPSAIHPDAERANGETEEWLRKFGLDKYVPLSSMRSLNIGELAAVLHPTVDRECLQLYADWCSWLFVHDDFGDSTSSSSLEGMHDRMLEVLAGGAVRAADGSIVAAFADLWSRTLGIAVENGCSEKWKRRIVRSFEEFFDAGVWENQHRRSGLDIDLEAYMGLRRRTSGMYMWIDLIEVSHRSPLPVILLCDPWVSEAMTVVNDVASWANDIFSARKEIAQGDPFNLVVIISREYRCDVEVAIQRAIDLHDRRVLRFQQLEPKMIVAASECDYDISWYVARMRSYMRGNLDWMINSTRRYLQYYS